jgi:hypothetical protein
MRGFDRTAAPDPGRGTPPPTDAGLVEVLCGAFLCRLRVYPEPEWAALPPSQRPAEAALLPGLGWVCPVPVQGLN